MNELPIKTDNSETRFFVALATVLALFFVISFIFGWQVYRESHSVPTETVLKKFPEVTITAKAAYIYDIRTAEVLFTRNEDARFSLASLTKLMSALVARESSPLYGMVTVNKSALQIEGDNGLYRDEKWLLRDLLDFSLLTSSNDGMHAVALALGALNRSDATEEEIINDFVSEMNHKASELSLYNTYFWNETGLDIKDEVGGAYGSARDISVLLTYGLANYPELFEATKETVLTLDSLDNRNHMAKNTNDIASEIPGLLVSKTGFTDTAGGNLAVVFDPELGRPIVITILGSTEEGRFDDMRILVNAVMEYIQQ